MAKIITEGKLFKDTGMDTDSSISEISPIDIIESYNLITTGNIEGEDGNASNVSSTVEITGYTLPAGINKCIGAERFENERIILAFIYNSFGYHQFLEYNYDTDQKTLLFTNLTDSAGIDVLPLTVNNFISDIKLVNGTQVIFTDSNLEVGYIDKERLKSGDYGVLTKDDWRLIKAQPLTVPLVRYGDDSGRVVNLMKENLFQYRSQYIFPDDQPSVYSSISKRVVPTKESTTSIGEDVTKNNNQIISVDAGTNRVIDINIAARQALLDWFTVKSVKRSYVLALPSTVIDIPNEVYEAYDPTTNLYSFVFYNDTLNVNIDPRETDEDYDHISRKVETLELLDSGILALAGLTEGYARPTIGVNLTVADYDPKLATAPLDSDPLRIVNMFDQDPPGQIHKRRIRVIFDGVAKTGDKINIVTDDFRDSTSIRTYDYTVPSGFNNNTLGALQDFAAHMPDVAATAYVYDGGTFMMTWIDVPYFSVGYGSVINASVGSGQLSSIHALKGNSSYQACLFTYDHYGRPLPIITGNEFVFKTNSYAQSKGLSPRLSWQLSGNFPVEVESFQWGLSENTTHQTTLFVNSKYLRTDGDYMVLSINPLKIFNERNKSSILTYEYSAGDRATFMYYDDSGTKVYFDNPFVDVQVAGFDIVVDTVPNPDTTTYELKVRLNPSIDPTVISGKNIYIEIYSPKKRVIVDGDTTTYLDTLFFEIGEQFNVINGVPQVTSGTITDGDIYFQTRDYVSAVDETTYSTYLAEDFNFSPLYKSNYTSYGRGFVYNDRDGIKYRKAGIRYSDKFVVDTRLNLLNRFYGSRIYGDNDGETSSIYGWIRKIRQRGNYLVCLQEVIQGHIPIFQSIVEDQDAQSQAFLSDKLFNKIRYTEVGAIGMGNAPESFSESPRGDIGYVDPNNSVPMRDGQNGLTDISGKMSKFFKQTIQLAKKQGKAIISYWDNYTKQRIFSIQSDEDTVVPVPFDTSSFVYLDDYTVLASDITITVQPSNATVTLISGQWTITPNAGVTGAGSFKFSFPTTGGTVEKNGCFTIIAGDTTPIQFTFIDLTDQPVSTVVYSNLIGVDGINVPVAISITGGQYSKNGGTYTSSAGKVVQDDVVQVRQTTSASVSVTTNAVLTIGGVSDTFSATTAVPSVGNQERKQTFQRNNCSAGSSGTYYEYVVPADTYFAGDLAAANALADADIAANGQNAANTNGACLVDTVLSIFVIDVQGDSNCNVCMYIDTPTVTESGNIVAVAQNFYEITDSPESAYMLASDNIAGGTTRRFELNIGKLISLYPNDVTTPQFIYKLRGRTITMGTLNGVYALKYPTQRMIMTGSAGSYIPSITPAGGPIPTAWSGSITNGADGTVGVSVGNVIKTFTYDRASNTIIVS